MRIVGRALDQAFAEKFAAGGLLHIASANARLGLPAPRTDLIGAGNGDEVPRVYG